ncbi:MAG: AAA family ATPase [Candidatus Pacebacteria bacterium]|nr:AAA family ATPase [Candidatus Paceibacterota bacterium]MCF7856907.1 AAA family ATPase [Candidatus Paceibacterota bacterium]
MIIGITGTDGAGKGTVVGYLVEQKGFVHYSARAIWIKELNQQRTEPTRANMRLIANKLREENGNDFLVTFYLKKINEEGVQNAVIESIRTVAEAETLKKRGGILIAIDADQKIRYERVQKRRSESDHVSFEQFVEHEILESNDLNPHGMQKQKVIAMADYTIHNGGILKELHEAIESLFKSLQEERIV